MEESSAKIVAEFIWDPREYAALVKHLSRERMQTRGWRTLAILGSAWLLWILGRLVYSWLGTGDSIGTAVAMLPWVLFGLLWIWIYRGGGGRLAARRAMKLDPRVDRLQRHVIDDQGIYVDSGNGSSSLPWSGMAKVAETDEHFLWYWHAQMAHYTPKRVMTDGDIDAVRDLILLHAYDRAQLCA